MPVNDLRNERGWNHRNLGQHREPKRPVLPRQNGGTVKVTRIAAEVLERIPSDRGTYILLSFVSQMRRLQIGRMGVFDIVPGYYAYVGSASGAGGLRAHLENHIDAIAHPHWHIDYLLGIATLAEFWFAVSDRKMEQDWADLLEKGARFRPPIPRFGSSDYHRSRTIHLFYTKRQPVFRGFQQLISDAYEPVFTLEQVVFGGRDRS